MIEIMRNDDKTFIFVTKLKGINGCLLNFDTLRGIMLLAMDKQLFRIYF